MLGSGCPEEDIAQGVVMGELPETWEAAHQQAVDPGAEDAAAEGEPPTAVPDTVLNPGCHLTEAVVALHLLRFLAKPFVRVLNLNHDSLI